MAFILIMPTLAAASARYCPGEMVLVLHLMTIFSFLLALQLEHASSPATTVGHGAGSILIVRGTTVEKIRSPFAFGRRGVTPVFQLPIAALRTVRMGLRRPPSRTLLGRALPLRMLAQVLVYVRVLSMANSINRSTRSA